MTTSSHSSEPQAARAKLAIALMNQGHAQQLTNEPGQVTAAIASYEQAIALLRTLPVADNADLANSLGASWMNRGQLLHRLRSDAHIGPALESFQEALTVFQSIKSPANPWVRRNLLGTILNRAVLSVDLSEYRAALADARLALRIAPLHERDELVDADLSVKLRRVACDALGQLIPLVPAPEQSALAAEASDFVDDGLALAREWSAKGESALNPVALRLFHFGAQLYRTYQPHFLAEFILEEVAARHATLSPDVIAIARENLEIALAARPAAPFLVVGDPASERHVMTARDLQAALDHLRTLAPQSASPAP